METILSLLLVLAPAPIYKPVPHLPIHGAWHSAWNGSSGLAIFHPDGTCSWNAGSAIYQGRYTFDARKRELRVRERYASTCYVWVVELNLEMEGVGTYRLNGGEESKLRLTLVAETLAQRVLRETIPTDE